MKKGVVILHFEGIFYPAQPEASPLLQFCLSRYCQLETLPVYYTDSEAKAAKANYMDHGNELQADEFEKGLKLFEKVPKSLC